ncbi:hypothetical protein TRIUR3_09071 [Triticum urartu]|uniref:Pectin acetylesterase n=1 Tax=Triticum urartu TaxID=4572 RepID=M7ZCB2_TRIUA|nr:hypothetical protein TRIUR3_09071 [Triticum urartu]
MGFDEFLKVNLQVLPINARPMDQDHLEASGHITTEYFNKFVPYYITDHTITKASFGSQWNAIGIGKATGVCLDGSAPGYHLQRGSGSGSQSWLIHLEGGGWCRNLKSCASRQKSMLGSSHYMERQVEFAGMLSDDEDQNPDFHNWNKVKIRYCDGASFSGDVKDELQNGTKFFFRGQRIWEAVMDELLMKGLRHAKQDLKRKFLHCSSSMDPGQCFFPREVVKDIRTPVFILNPAYDAWQVQHVLAPEASDPQHSWQDCRLDISKCSPDQLEILQGFREELHDAMREIKQKKDWGIFIDSCFIHCQTLNSLTWHSPSSPRVNNKTMAEAVGDWFFDRREVKELDCEYPCNPTCHNLVFSKPFKG